MGMNCYCTKSNDSFKRDTPCRGISRLRVSSRSARCSSFMVGAPLNSNVRPATNIYHMRYLLISVPWIFISFMYGVLGSTVGPGAVMIFCGIILGITGAIFHIINYIAKFELNWLLVGLAVSIASTVITISMFGGDTRKPEIILFLWLFYIIPSVGIYPLTQFMIFRCEKRAPTVLDS